MSNHKASNKVVQSLIDGLKQKYGHLNYDVMDDMFESFFETGVETNELVIYTVPLRKLCDKYKLDFTQALLGKVADISERKVSYGKDPKTIIEIMRSIKDVRLDEHGHLEIMYVNPMFYSFDGGSTPQWESISGYDHGSFTEQLLLLIQDELNGELFSADRDDSFSPETEPLPLLNKKRQSKATHNED